MVFSHIVEGGRNARDAPIRYILRAVSCEKHCAQKGKTQTQPVDTKGGAVKGSRRVKKRGDFDLRAPETGGRPCTREVDNQEDANVMSGVEASEEKRKERGE